MGDRPLPTVAFVVPWFGEEVVGGAETLVRQLAENLHASRGLAVEVLTTCARDGAGGWSADFHKEGTSVQRGVTVRRFKLDRRPKTRFDDVNSRLMRGISVTPEEEALFLREIVNSSRLYDFIDRNKDNRVFVFAPYPFGTTYWGAKVAPDRSFLIPCLHDEGYAHMMLMREMFQTFQRMLFLSLPEMALARRLYDLPEERLFLLGAGVDVEATGNADRFRERFGVREPFVLYVGRRSVGKSTPLLIDYFCRFKERTSRPRLRDLKLVLAGSGPVDVPAEHLADVVDLGFLSEEEKRDAYAAALLTCQPSVQESFSLVIMESWVQRTPVLVHAACDVTRDHCLRSNGGLFFANYGEFAGCLEFLDANPVVRRKMGRLGREYVRANSSWERITEKFVSAVFGE
ncbi:MAG: glycosyltransferase family 4 protein [Dehalococcoidales bacterium]|nr:glycosyltransferase family 4 protein [Dehalococcoidales bacterium]